MEITSIHYSEGWSFQLVSYRFHFPPEKLCGEVLLNVQKHMCLGKCTLRYKNL